MILEVVSYRMGIIEDGTTVCRTSDLERVLRKEAQNHSRIMVHGPRKSYEILSSEEIPSVLDMVEKGIL